MQSETPTILKKILHRKAVEVRERKANIDFDRLQTKIQQQSLSRGFINALKEKIEQGQSGIIAEVKKASPSKGVICENFHPAQIAKAYEAGGAACLSVLTDIDFFQGSDEHLKAARAATTLPVLRKDFVIDRYQIHEARAIGADCILLIAAALEAEVLTALYQEAVDLGMDVLIEVHNKKELESVLPLKSSMIGINNRDLHTFETTLQTTLDLLGMIPDGCVVVTESGILKKEDVTLMKDHDVNAFLVGEAFMKTPEPGEELKRLFS